MRLICCYCSRYIKEKKPFDIPKETHGICPDCYISMVSQTEGLSYNDYLETFEVPVVLMNANRQLLAANKAALAMMGKTAEDVLGKLGGEALGCRYSKLPGGCGRTVHCETCSIRNLVLRTISSGVSNYNELVSMETGEGENVFLVSTIFNDGLVQVVFENCLLEKGTFCTKN